ncbi:hypothetical protein [Psittacicella gerlachiana]|nr:hypothetical protein [Psittacicella gerlachiana]
MFQKKRQYSPDLYRSILIELEFTVNFTNRLNFNDPIVNSVFHLNRTARNLKLPIEKSYNHDVVKAFRMQQTEGKSKANGTGLLVLTFSSLYASLLMANHQDRDLRHLLLMKIVTFYDFYLSEVDPTNPYVNVSALTTGEFNQLVAQMQDPQKNHKDIIPERFQGLPLFSLTSALFKYVYNYLCSEHNIYRQQRILDALDLYMSSHSYVAFTLGLGATYHASMRKLGLESQAPFWFFKFDFTDQQTRTLNYITDNFIFNEALGDPESYYELGRLFAQSKMPLHEFARSVKSLGVMSAFPREPESKEFYQEHIAKQQANYPESFHFIVDSLRKAYARVLSVMVQLRAQQQDPEEQGDSTLVTEKDPAMNLDMVLDLNSYLGENNDQLYFANQIYHLADIYTNCNELPDFVPIDYNSPTLLPVNVDCYQDDRNSVFVPAFVDLGTQALAPVILKPANAVLSVNLNREQKKFANDMLKKQAGVLGYHCLVQNAPAFQELYKAQAQQVKEQIELMSFAGEKLIFANYTEQQLAYIDEVYKQALASCIAETKQDSKAKYFLTNELLPKQRKGLLTFATNNQVIPLSELLEPSVNYQDEYALLQALQTERDLKFRGQASVEHLAEIDQLLAGEQTEFAPKEETSLQYEQLSQLLPQTKNKNNHAVMPERIPQASDFAPELKAEERPTRQTKVKVTPEVKPAIFSKDTVLRVSRSARKKGKK